MIDAGDRRWMIEMEDEEGHSFSGVDTERKGEQSSREDEEG